MWKPANITLTITAINDKIIAVNKRFPFVFYLDLIITYITVIVKKFYGKHYTNITVIYVIWYVHYYQKE